MQSSEKFSTFDNCASFNHFFATWFIVQKNCKPWYFEFEHRSYKKLCSYDLDLCIFFYLLTSDGIIVFPFDQCAPLSRIVSGVGY
jgi:hypothetical protein